MLLTLSNLKHACLHAGDGGRCCCCVVQGNTCTHELSSARDIAGLLFSHGTLGLFTRHRLFPGLTVNCFFGEARPPSWRFTSAQPSFFWGGRAAPILVPLRNQQPLPASSLFFAAFPCLLGLDPCRDSLPCNIYVCALILLHRYILQTNSGEGKKTWGEQFARNISGRVYGTPADSRPLCRRTTSTSRIFTAPRSC